MDKWPYAEKRKWLSVNHAIEEGVRLRAELANFKSGSYVNPINPKDDDDNGGW